MDSETNIFAYGSLMFEPVWKWLVRRPVDRFPAWLSGYQRRTIRHDSYPVLAPGRPADSVEGVLYCGVTEQELARLDGFEGEWYERIAVKVSLEASAEVVRSAWTYRLKERYAHLASTTVWDPGRFARNDLAEFIASYCPEHAPGGGRQRPE